VGAFFVSCYFFAIQNDQWEGREPNDDVNGGIVWNESKKKQG
jgi:hypothetical protein